MLTVMVMVVGEEDTEVAEGRQQRKKKEIIFSVFLLFISSAEFVLPRRNFSSNYLLG